MLNLLFSLVMASVSAQNVTLPGNTTLGLPPACLYALSQNMTGLSSCGAYFGGAIANGFVNASLPSTLPSASDLSAPGLDAFCSTGCSSALASLVGTFFSPPCAEVPSPFQRLNLTKADLPAAMAILNQAMCVKDGSTYCAGTLFALLGTDTNSPAALMQAQSLICSNCAKLEAEIFAKGIPTLSLPLQSVVKPPFELLGAAQKDCPVAPPTPTPNAATGINGSPLLAFVLMLLSL